MRFSDGECGRCHGTGEEDCLHCGGRGTSSANGQECRVCHGTGKQPCGSCYGIRMTWEDDEELRVFDS